MNIRLADQWDQVECAKLFDLVTRRIFPQDLSQMDALEHYYKYAYGEEQYVAEIDGKIRGLLSIFWPDKFIHTLFVHPDFHRKKIGSNLLDHVCSILPGVYDLKVDKDNIPAQVFYRARGWKAVEEGVGGEFNVSWWRYRKIAV